MTRTTTLKALTANVTLTVTGGPDYGRDEDGWERNDYRLTLRYQGRQFSTRYFQGLGITDDPNVGDVMESLLSDAMSVEMGEEFEEWAADLGYDPDSRKGERIYNAVVAQTAKLRRFLGDEFETFLYAERDDQSHSERARKVSGLRLQVPTRSMLHR